jgi:hypothetical protein
MLIYKPKSCKECPAYRENKNKCWCGVDKYKKQIDKENIKETSEQWDNCLIDWDREDG